MTTVMVIDDRRDAERVVSRKLIDMGFEVFSRDGARGIGRNAGRSTGRSDHFGYEYARG